MHTISWDDVTREIQTNIAKPKLVLMLWPLKVAYIQKIQLVPKKINRPTNEWHVRLFKIVDFESIFKIMETRYKLIDKK